MHLKIDQALNELIIGENHQEAELNPQHYVNKLHDYINKLLELNRVQAESLAAKENQLNAKENQLNAKDLQLNVANKKITSLQDEFIRELKKI